MAYLIGGKTIYDLAEVASISDPRSATGFSTTTLFTYSGYSFQDWYGQKMVVTSSGYMYDNDINNGKYKSVGYFMPSKRGWRPYPTYGRRRWQSSGSGTYYITKFYDGEVWVSTTAMSRSGTRIGTAAEDIHFLYVIQISGGGGGAGGNSTQSGGGGGGGSWAYHCVRIYPNMNYRMVIHPGGGGGGRNSNGGTCGGCSFELYRSTDYSTSGVYSFWLTGGGGAGVQSGGAGGGIGNYNPANSNAYIQNLEQRSGQAAEKTTQAAAVTAAACTRPRTTRKARRSNTGRQTAARAITAAEAAAVGISDTTAEKAAQALRTAARAGQARAAAVAHGFCLPGSQAAAAVRDI